MGRSSDFKFWEEKLPVRHRSCGDEGEFCEVQRRGEDQVGAFSPPLWGRARVEFRPETSTLLPQNHQNSCLSPASRVRAIIDGRRELMEMIKDLPESSYELSLKDIVDQQNTGDVQEKEAAVSLSSKKKASPRKLPRICTGQSSEGPCRWYFSEKKYKSRRQRGCLF